MADSVRVRVPATSANLGPGFDAYGLALGLYDEVEVRIAGEGLKISIAGEGEQTLSRDENHLVVKALRTALERFGRDVPGLELHCVNRIPHGRGLGSSAAAICAGVVAAATLADATATDLLPLACEIEGHPDNVAACLLGGFTIAWTDGKEGASALRLVPDADVVPVVFVPRNPLSTSVARGLLPPEVPHADAAFAAGRAGLLAAALTAPDLGADRRAELLLAATEDRLHQPYRAPAMPDSAALIEALRADGVAAAVSGAGPTVLALTTADRSESVAAAVPDGWTVILPGVACTAATTV